MPDPRLARPTWRDGRTNVDAFTVAWVEHAEAIKRDRWPNRPEFHHAFVCTQGSYQGGHGDLNSSGTHDLGGPVDLRWCGHPECLLALRLAGGFVWHRTPAQGPWPDHIHGAPIGHPYMAPAAERQEVAYLNRRNGLANNGPDDGPRLDPIPMPVWPYPPEDIVTPEDIKAVAAETVVQLLGAKIADDGRTVQKALRQASKAAGLEDAIADRVVALLPQLPATATSADLTVNVKAAVKQALREGTGD